MRPFLSFYLCIRNVDYLFTNLFHSSSSTEVRTGGWQTAFVIYIWPKFWTFLTSVWFPMKAVCEPRRARTSVDLDLEGWFCSKKRALNYSLIMSKTPTHCVYHARMKKGGAKIYCNIYIRGHLNNITNPFIISYTIYQGLSFAGKREGCMHNTINYQYQYTWCFIKSKKFSGESILHSLHHQFYRMAVGWCVEREASCSSCSSVGRSVCHNLLKYGRKLQLHQSTWLVTIITFIISMQLFVWVPNYRKVILNYTPNISQHIFCRSQK